ncbi:MAG TPA: HK97 gp10 family phage protein, partial [Metabacillus sp.]|nr:HK97 gp10 family phage protein [Metabacillus sp.]
EEAKVTIAKNTVNYLKKNSPENTGDYAKGWAKKKVGTAQVIHNRTDYQLTHLLEKGHVNRDGSRTEAIPHIKHAEEKAINEYIEEVEKVIKG